ncbi:MAG: RsmE family RNA methyltransferase [Acidobacteriota bacterium]|nr:RsmE family RNA methyltransferase [Acidobacteriota bacterium]
MTSNQFFISGLPSGQTKFCLEGDEHFHLARVARVRPGDKIWLTDGQMKRILAEVISLEEDKTWLLPIRLVEENLKTKLILGLSLVKPATMDIIIEKATELGVGEIFPLRTARSFKIPVDRLPARKSRWERIARAALKQSKGAILPVLYEVMSLQDVLSYDFQAEQKIFLDERSQAYFRDILLEAKPDSVVLLVGPEGGWSQEEREVLLNANFRGFSLGERILKTETAVISAVTLISHFWNW